MKQLLIMRHAKSDWSVGNSDFDRPLNERGKKDAPFMGKYIKESGLTPDYILSSSAQRAKVTAQYIAKQCDCKHKLTFLDDFYSKESNFIIETIKQQPSELDTILIVGHNPTMEDTVKQLISNRSVFVEMPTSALAIINCDIEKWEDVDAGKCTLKEIQTPKKLKGE